MAFCDLQTSLALSARRTIRESLGGEVAGMVLRMYERRRAWFERYELGWMKESAQDLSAFEIRAALRKVLVLGVTIDSVAKWVANLIENEVLKPARDNPERKLQEMLAKAMRKRGTP